MNRKFWVAGLAAVLLVDGFIALQYSFIVMAENCATSDRWQCNETVRGLVVAALVAIPALYATLFVIAAMRARRSRPN